MNILLWIIFGALVGWIASKIMKTDAAQGPVANVFVGIAGALIGGGVVSLVGGTGITGFNLWSILVAVLGSVILIWLYKIIAGTPTHRQSPQS